MKKHGFTLSELLITLSLMAFLLTITMSTFKKITPNQEKMMLKKAYYLTERVISELVNDAELYPDPESNNGAWYLANTVKVIIPGTSTEVEGNTKFCKLFKSRLNVAEDVNSCPDGTNSESANYFTTTDGIKWYIEKSSFSSTTPCKIVVDVNGAKAPNRKYISTGNNQCLKPDQFAFAVYANGRVIPGGTDEQKAFTLNYLRDTKVSNEE